MSLTLDLSPFPTMKIHLEKNILIIYLQFKLDKAVRNSKKQIKQLETISKMSKQCLSFTRDVEHDHTCPFGCLQNVVKCMFKQTCCIWSWNFFQQKIAVLEGCWILGC